MNLAIKQDLQNLIDELIRSGQYNSPEEVVEAAVARLLLDDPEDALDDDDLEAIRESEEQIARGQVRDFKVVAAELRSKYLGRQ